MAPDHASLVRAPAAALPRRGVIGRIRRGLFSSWWNALLTLAALALLWLLVPPAVRFLLIDAVWTGKDRDACLAASGHVGACWAFVKANLGLFVYGRYPEPERWRVDVVFALGAVALVPLAVPNAPFKRLNAAFTFLV